MSARGGIIIQSLYLMGKRKVALDGNDKLVLNYYLVEEREVRNKPLYGIQIVQENNPYHSISEYTEPLSYSRNYVSSILDKLIEHNVLVYNLLEIVDDLIV